MKRPSQPPVTGPAPEDLPAKSWLLGLLLVAGALLAYQPAWRGQPIWDDDRHITAPGLRSLDGLSQIWIQPGATQQYYPMAHSAFWLEHRLWGDATLGYHLVNILLHAVSALLLLRILRVLEIRGAWLAAFIFALHPVHAESVAWIMELKNTLSGVFYLGAALAYLRFDQSRRWGFYALAGGLFVLALLSKTVVATLPAALLVVLWWQRGKLRWKQDALPLAPLFLFGIGAGLFTAYVERSFIGAVGSEFQLSLIERALIAGRALWFYAGKLVWPQPLIFVYPRWEIDAHAAGQFLPPLAAGAVLCGLWFWRERLGRAPLAAGLFFAGTLFPALGFFNVYPMRYSYVADHFQYLASLGLIVPAAAALVRLPLPPAARLPLGIVLAAVLGLVTWRQTHAYANLETLWRDVIAKNPNAVLAQNNLGLLLAGAGRSEEALEHYRRALESKPDSLEVLNNLGRSLADLGRLEEAIEQYRRALRVKPGDADTLNNLGLALAAQGRLEEAAEDYFKALQSDPNHPLAHNNLGIVLARQGHFEESADQFRQALRLNPNYNDARFNLGKTLARSGRYDEAISHLREVLRRLPNDASAWNTLADVCAQAGRFPEAAQAAEQAVAAAQAGGQPELAAKFRERLKAYREGKR